MSSAVSISTHRSSGTNPFREFQLKQWCVNLDGDCIKTSSTYRSSINTFLVIILFATRAIWNTWWYETNKSIGNKCLWRKIWPSAWFVQRWSPVQMLRTWEWPGGKKKACSFLLVRTDSKLLARGENLVVVKRLNIPRKALSALYDTAVVLFKAGQPALFCASVPYARIAIKIHRGI